MRRARQQRMMRDRAARPRRIVPASGRSASDGGDDSEDAEALDAELARRMLELEA